MMEPSKSYHIKTCLKCPVALVKHSNVNRIPKISEQFLHYLYHVLSSAIQEKTQLLSFKGHFPVGLYIDFGFYCVALSQLRT